MRPSFFVRVEIKVLCSGMGIGIGIGIDSGSAGFAFALGRVVPDVWGRGGAAAAGGGGSPGAEGGREDVQTWEVRMEYKSRSGCRKMKSEGEKAVSRGWDSVEKGGDILTVTREIHKASIQHRACYRGEDVHLICQSFSLLSPR